MLKKNKIDYIDYYRGIAILIIVAMHCLCWGKDYIFKTNVFIFHSGTFLFVFIAGFLFQYLSYKFDWKIYFKKKLTNVILPYIITLTPAVIWAILSGNTSFPLSSEKVWIQIPTYYYAGMLLNLPTWFIGMITIIFLLSPLLLLLSRNKIIMNILLLLSIFYTVVVPRPDLGHAVFEITNETLKIKYLTYTKLYLTSVLDFLSAYLMGMFLCNYIERNQKTIKIIAKPISIYSGIILFSMYLYFVYGQQVNVWTINIVRLIEIILILSILFIFEKEIKSICWLDKSLKFLAEYSFGIFFIHFYFINLLQHHSMFNPFSPNLIDIGHNSSGSLLRAFGIFCFSLFGSIIFLWITKFILNKLRIKDTRMFIGVGTKTIKK